MAIIEIITWNRIIILLSERNACNHVTVIIILLLGKNTWNHDTDTNY